MLSFLLSSRISLALQLSSEMNSDVPDPGLFDAPFKQPDTLSSAGASTDNRHNVRRIYRPVPAEKRNSKEYRASRERNNKAVQRCRANYKVKQDCLVIKSEGYRALAEEHLKATREMETQRKVVIPHILIPGRSTFRSFFSFWIYHNAEF